MVISYATKRNASGNRYLLIVDHAHQVYAREAFHWFCKEDYIEISKSDRQRIISALEDSGYAEVDRLDAGIKGTEG